MKYKILTCSEILIISQSNYPPLLSESRRDLGDAYPCTGVKQKAGRNVCNVLVRSIERLRGIRAEELKRSECSQENGGGGKKN
jgi:hypothetical protein